MDDGGQSDDLVTVVVGDGYVEPAVEPEDRTWEIDDVCAGAIELAREALLEEADAALVGEHGGLVADGPMVVTHYFTGHVPGYIGWRWAVTVTRSPDSQTPTVDETALLPDGDALLAPAWVPWKQRIQPGDIGAGDVLVTEADDPRLAPGMSDTDSVAVDDELQPPQWELGLGRLRMLSPEGRREAAQRWYREVGPRSAVARGADLTCASCGFLLLIGGPLGQAFGVCANGYAPADGRVVAMTFGCGAHSETVQSAPVPVAETVVDEFAYDEAGPLSDAESEPAEEPGTEEPAVEEPAVEEPAVEEPAVEEPATAEPATAEAQDGPGAEHATMQESEPEEDA